MSETRKTQREKRDSAQGKVATAAPRKYGEVRERIETGDLFMFSGDHPVSGLIRWASQSQYSHCGLAAWWGDSLMVLQADHDGIEARPVSEKIFGRPRNEILDRNERGDYKGIVDWWRLVPPEGSQEAPSRERLLASAIDLLGGDFATLGLVRVFFHTVFGRVQGHAELRSHPNAMFCSQFLSTAMRKAGWPDPAPRVPDHLTSPEHILSGGLYELGARIHTHGADESGFGAWIATK